jgi:protein-S-isoprenylcysteine O-methyltransferase Ste14
VTIATGDAQPGTAPGEHLLARAVPGAIFAVLLSLEVRRFAAQVGHHAGVAAIAGRGLYLLFIGLFVALTVLRPAALVVDRRPIPWLATAVGTFGLVVSPLFLTSGGPRLFSLGAAGGDALAVLALVAIIGALASLSVLGMSFSLTPQARHLVGRGPYRLIRHPMYFFEGLTMVGGMLGSGRLTSVVMTVLVLGAQVVRIHYEEVLLRSVFPDYEARFAGVAHLVPGIY